MSPYTVFSAIASLLALAALAASAAHGQVLVSLDDAAAFEGNPPSTTRMVFPVSLSAPAPAGASIRFSTAPGTATSPDDFDAVADGLLSIPAGVTHASIQVELVEDDVEEPLESFTLTLLGAENLVLGRATATGVIVNDDYDITGKVLSIGDASVLEGNDVRENVRLSFPITLATPSSRTVSVRVSTTPGSASDRDFTPINHTISIPAGATSALVTVSITEDDVLEPDETFTATLYEPTNATLGSPTTATGAILNDDTIDRTLSIGDVSAEEGDEGDPRIVFPLTLSHPAPPGGVQVYATTISGSAVASVDYRGLTRSSVRVPEGQLTWILEVRLIGDLLVEPDETFTLVISDPVGVRLDDATATGTILDDDLPRVVTVGDATVVEGDSPAENVRLRFPLTLSLPSAPSMSADTSVRVTTHAGTATSGSDFEPFDDYVIFPSGSLEAFVEIPVHEDARFEPGETFTVSLSPGFRTTLGEPSTATGTILNDDDDVTVSVSDASIEEGGAAGFLRMLRFPLALDRPSSKDVRVVFVPLPGSATAPDDYLDLQLYSSVNVDHVAVIPAGATAGFAEVGVYQDVEIEPDETFTIELDPEAMQVGTGTATGTILNDDAEGVPALGAGGALLLAGALLAAARCVRPQR